MKHYHDVSLGILAGGRATRLQGVDKAFVEYENRYLSERVLEKVNAVFAGQFISARGPDSRFSDMGLVPVHDRRPDFSGPLAGIEALLLACESEYLLSIPVDIKFVPADLIETWLETPMPCGMVLEDANGLQPLLALWHVDTALPLVTRALDRNEKAVRAVLLESNARIFTRTDVQIGNLNTPRDFETP